jgi:integrase
MRLEETLLRHLLEWMEEKPFEKAPGIRPTLPEYMLTIRLDGKEETLSFSYIKKTIRAAYRFFGWVIKHRIGYRDITQSWLDTLKPSRMPIEYKEHEAVTLDEIRAIAKAPVFTIRDKRIRAAAVLWFLSGIRVGAFVTLPIMAVDLDNLKIKQWPRLGVRTKFKKHATTDILNIPELLDVVREWDKEVRAALPDKGLWFAPYSPETGKIDNKITRAGEYRYQRPAKDLKVWLQRVGLPYHSPHKFRHGFAVIALKNAKDIQALKAVSQTLMHSNLSITDGVYGILSQIDVSDKMAEIGQKITSANNNKH